MSMRPGLESDGWQSRVTCKTLHSHVEGLTCNSGSALVGQPECVLSLLCVQCIFKSNFSDTDKHTSPLAEQPDVRMICQTMYFPGFRKLGYIRTK